MVYIKFKERSLSQFASNTKPLDTLTHWNLGFTIVTSALKKFSYEKMFFNFCKICSVRNGFCINNKLPMNKQNTKKAYFHFFVLL